MTMRPFLAICRDGLRESKDKRSLLVLLLFGLACVAFCFGISFDVWMTSVGTTAAFVVLCLALAVWLFRRRDF